MAEKFNALDFIKDVNARKDELLGKDGADKGNKKLLTFETKVIDEKDLSKEELHTLFDIENIIDGVNGENAEEAKKAIKVKIEKYPRIVGNAVTKIVTSMDEISVEKINRSSTKEEKNKLLDKKDGLRELKEFLSLVKYTEENKK